MAIILSLIIILSGTVLVLTKRLMQIVSVMEKSKVQLEDNLRDYTDEDFDDVIELYKVYITMAENEVIEKNKEEYKKSVLIYTMFLTRQPWKVLAWVLKLPPSDIINNSVV